MKNLTTEEKLSIMEGAKARYLESIKSPHTYHWSCICDCITRELRARGILERENNNYDTQTLFPELMKYKPEGVDPRDLWWSRKHSESRILVFNLLIEKYEQELYSRLPWYTKLFNQIKNLF